MIKAILAAILTAVLCVVASHKPVFDRAYTPECFVIQNNVVEPYVELEFIHGNSGGEMSYRGSGTVIELNNQLYILTVAHLNEPGLQLLKIKVFHDKFETTAELIHYEDDLELGIDCCLIKPVQVPWLKPATFLFREPKVRVGEDCYYIGTPDGTVHSCLERSIISSTTTFYERESIPFYRANGNGFYGNSGGGLFVKRNNKWELVGIVARKYSYADNGPMLIVKHFRIVNFLQNCFEKM